MQKKKSSDLMILYCKRRGVDAFLSLPLPPQPPNTTFIHFSLWSSADIDEYQS